MEFWKMNGAGNDFIVVDDRQDAIADEKWPEIIRAVCERHMSIGADGFMVVKNPTYGGDYKMLFFNSDGSLGEMCGINQVPVIRRVLTCLPLVLLVAVLLWWSIISAKSFNHLWNYFAWGNQVISATTLLCGVVWLVRQGKRAGALIAAGPAVFMTTVVMSFILWASADKGQPWGVVWKWTEGRLVNCGCPLGLAVALGGAFALVLTVALYLRHGREPSSSCCRKESRS